MSAEGTTEPTIILGEETLTATQVAERLAAAATSKATFDELSAKMTPLMPLSEAVSKKDTAAIKKAMEDMGISFPTTDSSRTSKSAAERIAMLEEDVTLSKAEMKAAREEAKLEAELNKAFDAASAKYGEEFSKNESALIDYMKEHGLRHTQLEVAWIAFKTSEGFKAAQRTDAASVANSGRRSMQTDGKTKVWDKENFPDETAYETFKRLGMKLDD